MKYSFKADSIDIGIDDTEEFYSITLTQKAEGGGPALNYLTLQRSMDEVKSSTALAFQQPYIEFNDPSNGRFSHSFAKAALHTSSFVLTMQPGAGVVTHPGLDEETFEIDELTVEFTADGRLLRKFRVALKLVIADGFEFDVVG